MFDSLRRAADALHGLLEHMAAIRQVLEDRPDVAPQEPVDFSPVTERLDRLEIGYATWEAKAEATLMKADAVFKNARNSEERVRSRTKKADGAIEDGVEGQAEMAEAYRELGWVQAPNANGGPEEGLHGVRPSVEVQPRKALALRAKFG